MRTYDPLKKGHPILESKCAICHAQFVLGDVTTLIPVKPSESASLNWVAIPAHAKCVEDMP